MSNVPQVGSRAPEFDVVDGRGERLRLGELRGQKVMLLFRRYLGCSLCREEITQLAQREEAFRMRGVRVLFFVDSPAEEVTDYVRRHEPGFHLVSDPRHLIYEAYGVRRGGLGGYLRPAVLRRAAPALLGYGHGMPTGAELQLPGDFVIDEHGEIAYAHVGRHIADTSTVDKLLDCCRG